MKKQKDEENVGWAFANCHVPIVWENSSCISTGETNKINTGTYTVGVIRIVTCW